MRLNEAAQLRYLTFDSLSSAGILHGVLTRRGGVSPNPWAELNLGATVGDDPENVRENRRLAFEAFGLRLDTLFDVWQVHSATVVCADSPRPPEQKHMQADAILTDARGVTLFMRFADCTPILLFDPHRKVVGLVHAGWLGTVRRAVPAAIDAMRARYGSHPGDILAAIGPSIGPDHYEVGPDVTAQIRDTLGARSDDVIQPIASGDGKKAYLDLWKANQIQLESVGVERIEVAGVCTACHLEDWYSHRAEKGRTGRFGALIAL